MTAEEREHSIDAFTGRMTGMISNLANDLKMALREIDRLNGQKKTENSAEPKQEVNKDLQAKAEKTAIEALSQ